MREIRPLTEEEFNRLLKEAPNTETRNLIRITKELGQEPYEYLKNNTLDTEGLLIDGRPIYFGAVSKTRELWTVVNSDVKEQITLYRTARDTANGWVDKYGVVYATMEKINQKNMRWTERLGFVKYNEDYDTVTFIKRSKNGMF